MNLRTKTILATFGTTVLTGTAAAQQERTTPMLDRGTQEFSVSGTLDIPESDELDYDIDASYGYFLRDGWEVGVRVAAADIEGADRVELGGFTEMNFRRNQTVVPFVGAGISLATAEFDDKIVLGTPIDDEDGLIFDIEGGAKFFLRPYMAISASIDFKFATDDVFETDDAIEDNLSSIRVGMRYYF